MLSSVIHNIDPASTITLPGSEPIVLSARRFHFSLYFPYHMRGEQGIFLNAFRKMNQLGLYFEDTLYERRIADYLESRRKQAFRIRTYKSIENFRDEAVKKPPDFLLSDHLFKREELLPLKIQKYFYISAGIPALNDPGYLIRISPYQSGEELLKKLTAEGGSMEEQNLCRESGLYMIFSPVGRSGKTRFALNLAKAAAEQQSVLLISLEENSWISPLLTDTPNATLSEALYYFMDRKLDREHLSQMLTNLQGVSLLPPVRSPEDLSAISSGELSAFFRELKEISGFEIILLDTDPVISRCADLFELCEKIFVPVSEDPAGRRKLDQFSQYLKETHAECSKRFIKVQLPNENTTCEPDSLKDLLGGSFGAFSHAVAHQFLA